MTALREAGREAYVVGGAVRDHLLNVTPQDIDIATSADTQTIQRVAAGHGWKTVEVGAFFGVVVVIVDEVPYDVATFRTETYGADSHRPAAVSFAASLREDLSRRDFTINAMALDEQGQLIDFFEGRDDLERGRIRTVGDPRLRFQEDALRMFRAARFAATLGFEIETATLEAVLPNLYRVRGLSVERIRDEIDKTLLGKYAPRGLRILLEQGLLNESCRVREDARESNVPILPELAHLSGLRQNPRYHRLDAWEHTLAAVNETRADILLRWASLLHDVAKGLPAVRSYNEFGEPIEHQHEVAGAAIAAQIAERLKFPAFWRKRIPWLVRHHLRLPVAENEAVIRWLRRRAREFKRPSELRDAIADLLEIHRADRLAGHKNPEMSEWERAADVILGMVDSLPFYPEQLAVSGEAIAEHLGKGPAVGAFQRTLLARIQTGELLNTESAQWEALLKKAGRMTIK